MAHKTLFNWFKYFVEMSERIVTGGVNLTMAEAILIEGSMIPPPEFKCPPLARDGDNEFCFKYVEANVWDYYKGTVIQDSWLMEATMNFEKHTMTQNYLIGCLAKGWYDSLEISFRATRNLLRGRSAFNYRIHRLQENYVREILGIARARCY